MRHSQLCGLVFNTQKFSLKDGAGIRTLIFLKGCPLRCRWCCNPESQRGEAELAFNAARCLTAAVCGRCLTACPHNALRLEGGRIVRHADRCRHCLACVRACPCGAHSVYGQRMSVEQVLARVEEDAVFYQRCGGGMTLSGGEPLMQADFACALLAEARRRRISTAIETSGCCAYAVLQRACEHLDRLIFDIKCADARVHMAQTGVDNALILDNFQRVCRDFPHLPVTARTPVIPGVNDTEEAIAAIRALVPRRAGVSYELLSYHSMGRPKYAWLGREYDMGAAALDDTRMARLMRTAR